MKEKSGGGGKCHCEVYDETANVWKVVAKPHSGYVELFGADGKLTCMQFAMICI